MQHLSRPKEVWDSLERSQTCELPGMGPGNQRNMAFPRTSGLLILAEQCLSSPAVNYGDTCLAGGPGHFFRIRFYHSKFLMNGSRFTAVL